MQRNSFLTLILALILSTACSNLPKEHKVVTPSDGDIRLSLGEINDGKVHFYTYKKSGKRINFFIRTDGEGDLSAYFDACYICYKKKRGYRVEGSDLICNECSLKFRIADKIWEDKNCSPIPIKTVIDSVNLIIRTENLEKGGKLF